nr:phosphoethanolamine--lipid A transferase [Acinetobacter sp. Marseille-Q1620]
MISRSRQFSLVCFNLIIATWLGVCLNFSFFYQIQKLTSYHGIKANLFLISTVLVLVAMYNVVIQILGWKWTAKVIGIILVLIGGFSSYFVNSLGVVISPDQIQNMMQTDEAEVSDLISLKFFFWISGFVILPIAFLLWVKIKPEPISRMLLNKVVSIVLSVIILGGLLFVYYGNYAPIFRENRTLKGMISPLNSTSSLMSYYRKKAPKEDLPLVTYGQDATLRKIPNQLPKLMVLVVGETARAESFSLNGYAKNTNPLLAKQEGLINFTQASSCGTSTAVSVPCMFSGMQRKDYDENLAHHREGLLDIAKRAGYKVTWIDNNSGCKGACNRIELYKMPESIKQKWCSDGECLDAVLVDGLKDYLGKIPENDQTPRLIVLHQVGSHGPAYYKRTTAEFSPFKPTCDTNAIQDCAGNALINSYDNSIVYTDHNLNQVIEILKANKKYQTGFWYLSDHGESTGEKGMYLHGAPYAIAPSQQTHIPMLMWFSPAWKKVASEQVNCLASQSKNEVSQDNLFPSLLSMLDIKTKTIDPKIDLLEKCKAQQK